MSILSVSHPPQASYSVRLLSILSTIYCILVKENPITWHFKQGKNKQADFEGPYYVLGAPYREVERGKAVIASSELLKQQGAFLFTGKITNEKDEPVVDAAVDLWHASTAGTYYFHKYELRGKVRTDSEGRFEVLTVPPAGYLGRAGHFHYIVYPSAADHHKYEELTSQSYVCTSNNHKEMDRDIINLMRKPRYDNMLQAWAIPDSSGARVFDLPELVLANATKIAVDQWNQRLTENDKDIKIVAGGHVDFQLSPKRGWW